MLDKNTLFKVLNEDGSGCWGSSKSWPLPSKDKPGDWVEVPGELEETSKGLHLCRIDYLPFWIGPAIFVAEYVGNMIQSEENTIVVNKSRLLYKIEKWNRDKLQMFAHDCYEHVIKYVEENNVEGKEELKKILDAGVYRQIPRLSSHYSMDFKNEMAWQSNKLLDYIA